MNENKNYIPGRALYAFSSKAFIKIDATESEDGPTVNVQLLSGQRDAQRPGLRANTSVDSINIQLDIFELISLTAVFLGHRSSVKFMRSSKSIEIKRQLDEFGGASCYAVGSDSEKKLHVIISSSRIFCAAMLCVSRLQQMHPTMPVAAVLESLAGTCITGKEIPRSGGEEIQAHASITPIANREIPHIDSVDPARKIPNIKSNSHS